jgi:hypothetical protein
MASCSERRPRLHHLRRRKTDVITPQLDVLTERIHLTLWFVVGLCFALLGVLAWPLGFVSKRYVGLSNCLNHAYSHYRRGGCMVIEPSSYTTFPHFKGGPDLDHLEEFSPVARKYKRMVPPPLFVGRVNKVAHD